MADKPKQFLNKFDIGEVISLQVYCSSLYGNNWSRLLVTDVISAASCAFFKFDAEAEHAKVIADPNVPVGQVPQSFNAYQYVVLAPPADPTNRRVIGLPWIIADTVMVESTRDIVGYFPNLSDVQMSELRKAISGVTSEFTLDWKA